MADTITKEEIKTKTKLTTKNKRVKRKERNDCDEKKMSDYELTKNRRIKAVNECVKKMLKKKNPKLRKKLRMEAIDQHMVAIGEEVKQEEKKIENTENISMSILSDAPVRNIFPGVFGPYDGDVDCKEFVDWLRSILKEGPEYDEVESMEEEVKYATDEEREELEEELKKVKIQYEKEKKKYEKGLEFIDRTTGRKSVIVEIDECIAPKKTLVKFELDHDATFGELIALHSRACKIIKEADDNICIKYTECENDIITELGIHGRDYLYNGESEIIFGERDVFCKFGLQS